MSEYVRLAGELTGDALNDAYYHSDLAVDALGRHRVGVFYNSSLKGKEYLERGLPVVSGVITELDDTDFPYYFRVPADDSSIDIDAIVQFWQRICKDPDLHSRIHTYAAEHFRYEKAMEPVLRLLQENDPVWGNREPLS